MNKLPILLLFLFFTVIYNPAEAAPNAGGKISGALLLDDSWEKRIYLSLVETFEKEFAISNNLIITSAEIDSLGSFQLQLSEIPTEWSLLRLHLVKKGESPNSLVIGGNNENYFFLVAKQNSEISLFNTWEEPIFQNTKVEGASYMKTFKYISELANYPDAINYESSLIEKEFIEDVVTEKLKNVADSCNNPLVSLYALYQIDFQADYYQDPTFYTNYLSKWENINSPYFDSFKLKFPHVESTSQLSYTLKYILIVAGLALFTLLGFVLLKRNTSKVEKLSVQERRVLGLLRKGMTNKEISSECNIELSTVKSHVNNIYSKLNIKSRREAINIKIKSTSL